MTISKTLVTKLLLLTIAFTFALSANYIFAVWTGPTEAPPGGNTPTPIHVGTTAQVKDGGLSLSSLVVAGGSYFQGGVNLSSSEDILTINNPEALNIDGAISLKEQSSSPTPTNNYGKIYAKPITGTPSVPDSYTKLLLHMDSLSFLDSSIGNHSVANNGVTISTTESKFGGTSAYFNGTTGYLTILDSNDWDLGTGKFTLDFWAKVDTDKLDNVVLSHVQDADNQWYLSLNANAVSDSDIRFYVFKNGSPNYVDTVGHSFKGSWTHIAVVKETTGSGKLKIYINGSLVTNNQRDEDISIDLNFTGDLNIGVNLLSNDGSPHYFKGYIDELRISKGIARWTFDFPPPTVSHNASSSSGGPYYMDSSGTEYSMIDGGGGGGHGDGTNCPAGQTPRGVDSNGNVQGCFTPANGGLTSCKICISGSVAANLSVERCTDYSSENNKRIAVTGFNAISDFSIQCQ